MVNVWRNSFEENQGAIHMHLCGGIFRDGKYSSWTNEELGFKQNFIEEQIESQKVGSIIQKLEIYLNYPWAYQLYFKKHNFNQNRYIFRLMRSFLNIENKSTQQNLKQCILTIKEYKYRGYKVINDDVLYGYGCNVEASSQRRQRLSVNPIIKSKVFYMGLKSFLSEISVRALRRFNQSEQVQKKNIYNHGKY